MSVVRNGTKGKNVESTHCIFTVTTNLKSFNRTAQIYCSTSAKIHGYKRWKWKSETAGQFYTFTDVHFRAWDKFQVSAGGFRWSKRSRTYIECAEKTKHSLKMDLRKLDARNYFDLVLPAVDAFALYHNDGSLFSTFLWLRFTSQRDHLCSAGYAYFTEKLCSDGSRSNSRFL